jgi:hypothetical protein
MLASLGRAVLRDWARTDRLFEPVPSNRLTNVRVNHAALWRSGTTLALSLPPDEAGGTNQGSFRVGGHNGRASSIEATAMPLD